jgi:hypothetical protein
MSRVLAALVLAPAPLSLVCPEVDRIAWIALLIVAGSVVAGWLNFHALGELQLARECRRPVAAEEVASDVR